MFVSYIYFLESYLDMYNNIESFCWKLMEKGPKGKSDLNPKGKGPKGNNFDQLEKKLA